MDLTPTPEPPGLTVILTPGLAAMNFSAALVAMGSTVVDPAIVMISFARNKDGCTRPVNEKVSRRNRNNGLDLIIFSSGLCSYLNTLIKQDKNKLAAYPESANLCVVLFVISPGQKHPAKQWTCYRLYVPAPSLKTILQHPRSMLIRSFCSIESRTAG